jgi:hypothetical protein
VTADYLITFPRSLGRDTMPVKVSTHENTLYSVVDSRNKGIRVSRIDTSTTEEKKRATKSTFT